MELGKLVNFLEQIDPEKVVRYGFGEPDSYRGYYHDIAFAPQENAKIGDMLNFAKSAIGKTFEGYKGGEYTMSKYSECWISSYGEASGDSVSIWLVKYWQSE